MAVHRRTFLQASTLAAASAASARVLAQGPSNNLHFGLIGAGGQGRFDAGNLGKVPGARFTAVCEINPVNAAEAKKINPDVKVYEDWSEMLSTEKDLQAVIVALPEHTHSKAAIAVMESGRDVFCEKPMAYSLEQARQMIETRDKTKRILQIGQQRRSNPLYYLAHQLVQKDGVVGEIMRADAFWDRDSDWKRPLPDVKKDFSKWGFPTLNHLVNWRLYREYGHGLMTENGTHQMDACGWLLGGKRPKIVCGVGASRYRDNRETHDICSAEYMYEGDVIVRFTQDFHQGFNFGWSYGELILGTEGALRVTAEQEIVMYDKHRKETPVPIEKLGEIEIAGITSSVDDMKKAQANRAGGGMRTFAYENEMRIFVNCIKTRKSPACTGEIGLNSIVPTIIGTVAQFEHKYQKFDSTMFV